MKNIRFEEKSFCLITDRLIRKYLTGVDVAEGYLLIGEQTVFFTDARYYASAVNTLNSVGIETILFKGVDSIKEYLIQTDCKKLLLDYERTTVKEYNQYKTFGYEIEDACDKLDKMRSVKSQEELALIRKSAQICEQAYHSAIKSIKVGMTETQLKDLIEDYLVQYGADGPAFETIVAFGENSAVPHHQTGDRLLGENVQILVDMGASYKGYLSDLTRTSFFGKPSKRFLEIYDVVKEANQLAIESITENTLASEADGIVRGYLEKFNLSKYFTHSLGHGVGIEIHEYPTLSKKCDAVLKENTVFTIEPGVYIDGELGIRIEDTVVIKNGRVERLFTDSKELEVIQIK